MKQNLILYLIIAGLVVFIFLQKSCDNKSEEKVKVEVTVPEKKGTFKRPVAIIKGESKKDSMVFVKGKTIYTEHPFNKRMAELYLKAQRENDSLKTLSLYLDAIQEKEQTQVFDDDNLKLEITAKTRGELLSLKPKYTIKEQKIKTEAIVKRRPAVYLGGGVSNNKDLTNFSAQAEIGLQINRDIISITADTNKNFGIKYLIKL